MIKKKSKSELLGKYSNSWLCVLIASLTSKFSGISEKAGRKLIRDKLRVLGLSPDVAVCATDRELDRVKPDPKGLLVAAEKLRTPVERFLFVGDRDERDGECARRVGMPYVIIDKNNKHCSNCFQNPNQFSAWFEKCTK